MEEQPEDEQAAAEEPSGPPPEVGHDDLLMLLQSVPERVGDLVAGIDEGRLRYRHGPAFPTTGEVTAHMAAAGLQLDHFANAICLETGSPPALATMLEAETPGAPAAIGELLADWQRVRRRSIDLLRGLSEERWEAPLEDPARGRMSIEEALRLVLRHELGHVAQLRNLTSLVPEAMPLVEGPNGSRPG